MAKHCFYAQPVVEFISLVGTVYLCNDVSNVGGNPGPLEAECNLT